jgi:hypothetical protein
MFFLPNDVPCINGYAPKTVMAEQLHGLPGAQAVAVRGKIRVDSPFSFFRHSATRLDIFSAILSPQPKAGFHKT